MRNSLIAGTWGQEERFISANQFPFRHGQPFTLELISAPGEVIVSEADCPRGHASAYVCMLAD